MVNQPHVIHSLNVKDSLFVKINGNPVKKEKYLPQISVRELHNYMILPISEESLFGAINFDEKVCIRYKYLRKYMPTYI